jgi:hypothetical protein
MNAQDEILSEYFSSFTTTMQNDAWTAKVATNNAIKGKVAHLISRTVAA